MINKLYELIKENYKFLIFTSILIIIVFLPLPYYIDFPGDVDNISESFRVESSSYSKGTINKTSVNEIRATIPTYLYALIKDDWDILKKEDITLSNEEIADNKYRTKIMLTESINNATFLAYTYASKDIKLINCKQLVTYLLSESDTNLKVSDEIIKINGIDIKSKIDIINIINNYKENDIINIEVIDSLGNNEFKNAKVLVESDHKYIGILLNSECGIESAPKIEYNIASNEYGSSAGLMYFLAIYDALIPDDLTHGFKIAGTGAISENGTIQEIGGIKYKVLGAINNDVDIFFTPNDNYDEALKYIGISKMKLVKVSDINDAIEYLESL